MNSIPNDLLLEILSRLPWKSISRFRCVSKLWGSMLRGPYFTELFLKRSWSRPRLFFAAFEYNQNCETIFYSSPLPQNIYEKPSSLVLATDFHIKFSAYTRLLFRGYASSLFLVCHRRTILRDYEDAVHVICNPRTGQYATLPTLRRYIISISFLGFDPIDKKFKVLSMFFAYGEERDDHKILTFGTGDMKWRKIQCPRHSPYSKEICINGVLFYLARHNGSRVIVCFDVRSEKFNFIDAKCLGLATPQLINYKGKLGCILLEYGNVGGRSTTRGMCMWVLEDVEKQEWSKHVYTFPGDELAEYCVNDLLLE
ncbi:unnamed protein product [Microthlaspi erraticum]|uniref:F-box domain-containing protein n=1 Tax=Microthlaspi erraticum TaxID=1685480 RepID=A0A6D2L3V0_9BRAS|nr:unnamed protein product [Microthlaspi erraticum]